MKKKYILFDFDGTLFDTSRDIIHAVNHARKKHNYQPLADSEIISHVGHGVGYLAKKTFADTKISPEIALASVMDNYRQNPATRSIAYTGVNETLIQLPPRKIFIISNKPKELILEILQKNCLEHIFAEIIGGDSLPQKKPDPLAIQQIQNQYGCSAQEMVMVGDMSPDIVMAKNAEIESIYCQYGLGGADKIGATWQISEFSQILQYV